MLEPLKKKFDCLPSEQQREVVDFIDFLTQRTTLRKKKKFALNWIGGLREYKGQFTALELQKKALQWRD